MANVLTYRVDPSNFKGKEVVKINTFGKFAVNNDKIWTRLLKDNNNQPILLQYEESPEYWNVLLDEIINELAQHNTIGITKPVFEQYKSKLVFELCHAYFNEFWAIYAAKTKQREDFRAWAK